MKDFHFKEQLALAMNNMSIRSVAKAHAESRLRLRPAFQRNLVWNKEQKSYLVDSILRNLPIPELYVQLGDASTGDDDLIIVVDGQQRISTCIEFLLGKLRLSGQDLDPEWAGCVFSELSERLQHRFRRYKLLLRELPDLNDDQVREIFQRLNRVVEPLLPQELRHAAYSGPYLQLIEAAAAHPALQQVGVFSARDIRRRGSDELVAEVVHALTNSAFPNKKEGLDEAFRQYELHGVPEALVSDTRRRFGRVFAQLSGSSAALRKTRMRNKSDFYSLVVLLLRQAESLPLPDEGSRLLEVRLKALSDRVAAFRKASSEGQDLDASEPQDELVLKYMRAVERAASDRLNRIRRNDALSEWLAEAFATGTRQRLEPGDEEWVSEIDHAEEEEAAEVNAEREALRRVLVEDAT